MASPDDEHDEIQTPEALAAKARHFQRLYEEELAKQGKADGAYIELSVPGNEHPIRVRSSDSPILATWRKKGEIVYYCEWQDGVMVRGISRGAEACWQMLVKYERANPPADPKPKRPESKPEAVAVTA